MNKNCCRYEQCFRQILFSAHVRAITRKRFENIKILINSALLIKILNFLYYITAFLILTYPNIRNVCKQYVNNNNRCLSFYKTIFGYMNIINTIT